MIDSESFLERYPGFTTPKLIKEALTQLGADAESDGLLGAILILLYGERKMQCALQQFLVENDHVRLRHADPTPPPQPPVSHEIGHVTLDESNDIALAPLEACRDLPLMSQIYLSFSAGDEKPLLERIVNIAAQDADKRRWPSKVAQALNALPGVPVQAGKRDGTRIIPGDGEKENLIYIDANATYDFTLQWALMNDDAQSQTARLDAWLPFPTVAKQGGKIYQTFLDFRSLRLQTDAPAILLPQWGSVLLTVPRVIIQILENGTRMIIMQRRLPQECYHSNGKLARYIAQEINDYTACLKVGKKQGRAIQPVDSVDENLIYVDPDCLQRSRLTASVVLMNDETRAPGFRAPE